MARYGLCPLCLAPESRLTDEDVTPKWVRSILAERLSNPSVRPSKTTVRICSGCNSRLNEKFEIPARSVMEMLIRGDGSATLSTSQMTLAASWIVKTTLIRLLADSNIGVAPEDASVARDALVEMIETGRPPSYISVRIGYFSQHIESPSTLLLPPPRRFSIPLEAKVSENLTANPSLHCLKWELLLSLERDRSTIQPLLDIRADMDRLVSLWPISDDASEVTWPPKVRLTMAAIEAHTQAWCSPESHYYEEKPWRD